MENQETPCLRSLLAWHQIEHNCGLKHSHDGRKPTSAFYFQITNSGCHGSLSEGWQRFPNHMYFLHSLNVFATVVKLQMKKLEIADVTVHYQEIGTWQMIPSSFPKVWRILDLFLPLFCFPKQESESLRFFWGLGRGKKVWDAEVRSGPVAISREKKTHLFSSFSLSAGVKHGDLERILFECHISTGIAEITITMSSRFLKFMGICQNEKNWGSCQKKRCVEGAVCRRSF